MICALRGPKLNIALGLQIFEFRACVKEISVGRFLTLSGRLFHTRMVAGRKEF